MLGFFVGFSLMGCFWLVLAMFDELFQPIWHQDHLAYDGELLRLKLDRYSGAGFQSKCKVYVWESHNGIPKGTHHNEFDFEFLGNNKGEPYLVQTNRTKIEGFGLTILRDFTSYSIFWNQRHMAHHMENKRVFPSTGIKPMGVYSSIWNADAWATLGGRCQD
ncbi:hypothetical protein NC652_031922 [Populus alba x Populus x berolinensis]|nr:hypothetical protein NC652_031922 [Populus alba x Populus x berolinensis]